MHGRFICARVEKKKDGGDEIKDKNEHEKEEEPEVPKSVVVIGATSTPDALDSSLRRAGRFDREICMGIPDVTAREHIFRVLIKKMRVPDSFDFGPSPFELQDTWEPT